ncbi:hypothetical protein R1sor_017796 [Riccia sorocarpa]|uniref:Uncharacterized protein n=1 Tax=Riccia sorocarpa TaxID=122646 RepID=A0ABD3I9Q2_9MARC
MRSSQPQDCPGLRQRTMELMEKSFMSKYDSGFRHALTAMYAFVPYSFKELKDVDVVDFSAMRQSNVIRWSEVMTAFGGEHSDEDEFRGTKIMHRQLLPYKPSAFLPKTVEKNLNTGLVSRKDYEEVLYYREAAPYGPTYYLMTLIAEVFWSHSRSNRFLMPQVYAYVRALHGHPYNMAKVIVKSTSYAESEPWVRWRMISKEGDITLTDLVEKFSVPITDVNIIREKCKLKDPDDLPEADLADQVDKTPKKLLPKKSKPTKVSS